MVSRGPEREVVLSRGALHFRPAAKAPMAAVDAATSTAVSTSTLSLDPQHTRELLRSCATLRHEAVSATAGPPPAAAA